MDNTGKKPLTSVDRKLNEQEGDVQAWSLKSHKPGKVNFAALHPLRGVACGETEGNVTGLQKCVKEKFGFSQTSRVGQRERWRSLPCPNPMGRDVQRNRASAKSRREAGDGP